MDYDFNEKNIWRRQVWNDVATRFKKAKLLRKAVVLYLPGPDDLDRPVALSKGFVAENLIGVERDIGIVRKLRKSGRLVIHGTLSQVVGSWPHSHAINCIMADYCCCPCSEMFKFIMVAISNGCMAEYGRIVVNGQRGRETGYARAFRMSMENELPRKHRGALIHTFTRNWIIGCIENNLTGTRDLATVCSEDAWNRHHKQVDCFMDARLFSYRSSVVMDSVAFNTPFTTPAGDRPHVAIDFTGKSTFSKKVRRQIQSVLAVRTMRKRGILSPCTSGD